MKRSINHLRRTGIAILIGLGLTGCALPGDGEPPAGAGLTPRPTLPAGRATDGPPTTPQAATPTAAAQPGPAVLGFEPQTGGPGTTVTVWGRGAPANAPVVVRLGFPNPTGEALASAVADADGAWRTTLVIPEALPSGERITQSFRLVAMDGQNQALASAPFNFIVGAVPGEPAPSGPSIEAAPQAVRDLLSAWSNGNDVRPYLAANLRDALAAGRPSDQVLGLHPIALGDWTVYPADLSRPSEVLFVPATLRYDTFVEERIFSLVIEDGRWKIQGSGAQSSAPIESTIKFYWPSEVPIGLSVQPFKSQAFEHGWVLNLAQPHAEIPDLVISGGLVGEAPGTKLDHATVRGLPAEIYSFTHGLAVVWQEDNQNYLVSGAGTIDELLAVAEGLVEIDRATWEQRVRPH